MRARSGAAPLRRLVRRVLPLHSRRRLWLERWLREPLRRRLTGHSGEDRAAPAGGHSAAMASSPSRPRLLFVLHDSPGGVKRTTLDLLPRLAGSFDCWVLFGDLFRLELYRQPPNAEPLQLERRWWRRRPWSNRRFRNRFERSLYAEILDEGGFDLVHIRHLLAHTFDLLDLSGERRLPVVLSLHDFYLACPSVHLLDGTATFCAGVCTPDPGQCTLPFPWLDDLPVLKDGHLERWRKCVRDAIGGVAAVVATSATTSELVGRVYPELAAARLRIIEHGRGTAKAAAGPSVAEAPAAEGPVRLLLPGHHGVHKGSVDIGELLRLDRAGRGILEAHILGTGDRELLRLGRDHGPYRRQDFRRHAERIRPSFVGLFSIWPETYSHTLTEAWSIGVPVIATDIGALGERVRRHGGGWLVPPGDAVAAYRTLLAVIDDRDEYERERRRASAFVSRSLQEMAADYRDLYRELLSRGSDRGQRRR